MKNELGKVSPAKFSGWFREDEGLIRGEVPETGTNERRLLKVSDAEDNEFYLFVDTLIN